MGLSAEWVGVRVPIDERVAQAHAHGHESGLEASVERGGWIWVYSWDVAGATATHGERLASALAEPVTGGWIFDSDLASLYGLDPSGGTGFEFAVNEAFDDDDANCDLWIVPQQRRAAAESLARWSRFAPTEITAETILGGMPGPDTTEPPAGDVFFGDPGELWSIDEDGYAWVFAEDGVRCLYDRLGFGSLDRLTWAADEQGEVDSST